MDRFRPRVARLRGFGSQKCFEELLGLLLPLGDVTSPKADRSDGKHEHESERQIMRPADRPADSRSAPPPNSPAKRP